MALVTETLYVEAGATYPTADGPVQFFITNDDGTVFDLSGYSAVGQIRKSASAASAVVTFTPSIDTVLGCVSFTISATSTALLVDPPYVWAIELTKASSGIVIRLAEGHVAVSPEVVR
jgi:hypothetical protein